jgi:hypothetical protein
MDFWKLILASASVVTVLVLGILFNLIRSGLSDHTSMGIRNIINVSWWWQYKHYLIPIIMLGVLYLGSSLLITHYSSQLSLGKHTATFTFLIFTIWATIFIPVNIFVYNVVRAEYVPPLTDRFWIYLLGVTVFSFTVAVLGYSALERLAQFELQES